MRGMSEQPTHLMAHLRRALVVLVVGASVVLAAAPGFAQPEGWSDPDPVDASRGLLVFLLAPVGLAILITLFTLLPRLVRGQREEPSLTAPASVGASQRHPELEA